MGLSTLSKKIKVVCENRQFNERWENEFLFADFGGKPQCIVCAHVMSLMKEDNIRRHYETTHKKSCVQASYKVCAIMAKNQVPFTFGKIIRQCVITMAKSFSDDKLANNFETVRTAEISKQLDAQLNKEIAQSKYFSVALDESTDITDVCQLLIFVKTVDERFSIKEELLDLVPLPTSVKCSYIYSALLSVVEKYCGFSKCSCIVTDGAKCMTGKNTVLVGLLRKNDDDVPVLHCIIHQEVLCCKFIC
ncbi:hypothetical protein PR048_017159 [Dryococelus australis]|uniref:SPIN-DOC-like zinc-finger domain-containing protein n=1 Tax=Dryococelus australis TaxID=614101 RepID=A0ABQ9H8R7_9NEOP|nr:hypothetical protein PR048_017159 [Dryococelus australis]